MNSVFNSKNTYTSVPVEYGLAGSKVEYMAHVLVRSLRVAAVSWGLGYHLPEGRRHEGVGTCEGLGRDLVGTGRVLDILCPLPASLKINKCGWGELGHLLHRAHLTLPRRWSEPGGTYLTELDRSHVPEP